MLTRACCLTGHRDLGETLPDNAKMKLYSEILLAVSDGYSTFLCGFAQGVDLQFAEIVWELKCTYPIRLVAVLPHRGLLRSQDEDFQRLLGLCDSVEVLLEEDAAQVSQEVFCRYMAERASRIIAVYDGRAEGGTAAMVSKARLVGVECKIVSV